MAVRITDQTVVAVNNKPLREQLLEEQIHYYVQNTIANKIKVLMY